VASSIVSVQTVSMGISCGLSRIRYTWWVQPDEPSSAQSRPSDSGTLSATVTTVYPTTASIARGAARLATSVSKSEQVTPSLLSLFGLAYLALSPFSVMHGNMRFVLTVLLVAAYAALRPKVLDAQTVESLRILDRPRLRQIYIWSGLLFVHAILCAGISTAILLQRGEVEGMEILDRCGKQLGTLLLSLVQLVSGYHLAKYVSTKIVRSTIYATFWIMLIVCGYQIVAERLGLPYVGIYAVDREFGLRLSGLAGEPKGLSVYMLAMLPLLLASDTGSRWSTLVPPLPRAISIALALYVFYQTASANGFLSAAIMIAMYFLAFTTPRRALLGIILLLAALAILPGYELSGIQLRESHQSILNNIQNLDLGLFDDLISLPLIAWRENPLSLLIGFGHGFLHFFAWEYIDQGSWIIPGVFIDGGIGAIKYLSDFGLIVGSVLFLYIFGKARRVIRVASTGDLRPLKIFFLSVFVLGVLVGGNGALPLFVAAGWILGVPKAGEPNTTEPLRLTNPQGSSAGH
jgi:hypothetical protein